MNFYMHDYYLFIFIFNIVEFCVKFNVFLQIELELCVT